MTRPFRALATLLLLLTLAFSLQACVEEGVLCTSWIYDSSLVSTTQTTLSGIGATKGTFGCTGAPGQDYTASVKIWTAPGGISDPSALTTISMINGCVGVRCSTVVRGFYSNNVLSAAVTGNYPFQGTFSGLSQVTFVEIPLPHDLTGWEVNIF